MNGQQLKNSILQLAIQGRLVPQDSNDEPASALLSRIREEKMKLLEEKKIKKDKPLAPIKDEEKPFEIPESWEWVRLGEITSLYIGKTPERGNAAFWSENDYPWISISDMTEYGHIKTTKESISKKAAVSCFKRISHVGSLIMSFKLTVGRTSIIDIDAFHNEAIVTIDRLCDDNNYIRDYLFYLLPLLSNMGDSKDAIKGKTLNSTSLNNLIIPLPPLTEQHRIVEKIEELLPLVEEYDEAQTKLDKLNNELPEKLKNSILQQAIMGRLDTRNDKDEPASALLARIREEKKRLVEEKKVKKDRPLAPIKDEEKPFEIPESWEWVRLGEVSSIYGGKRIPAGSKLVDYNTGHIYIRVADMKLNTVLTNNLKYVPEDIYLRIKQYVINKDDLYITVAGTIGDIGEVPDILDGANLTENADKIVFRHISKRYLLFALLSKMVQNQIKQSTTKVGQPKLAIIRIQNLVFPLPPLAEQHRIVDKLDKIFEKIESMKI